jgi:crotonobetainyl-CoA:carnitine CoA-transferase CaiB-like acyl-CoA transferase
MACTGTPEVNPIKFGAPAIDYATGTMGAFALSAALFQREKTGRGQHIDLAMMDVAMMMMASHVTSYGRSGKPARPRGNDHGNLLIARNAWLLGWRIPLSARTPAWSPPSCPITVNVPYAAK